LTRHSLTCDEAVAEDDAAIGAGGEGFLVRDHDHRRALLAIHGEEQVKDCAAGGAIEIASGLVGEEDGRFEGEGAGEGDALLFAAGKLHGVVIEAALEADAVQEFAGAIAGSGIGAREFHGQEHVLLGGERGNQVVGLEDETDLAAPQERHFVLAQMRNLLAIQNYLSRSRRIEAGQQTEQGAFTAAGGSHDRGELAPGNLEIDAFENFDPVRAGVNGFGKSANLNQVFIIASLAAALGFCGCGGKPDAPPQPAARALEAAKPADSRPAIVCFGDSITAGFGLDAGQSFPDLLQPDLDGRKLAYRVVNLGISGDTTQDGLARMEMALAERPAIVLLELGGNDGLRGVPLAVTQANLARMIESFQGAGARVVLAGMSLPPNYGAAFIRKFEAMYVTLANQYHVKLIPFLLAGVGGHDALMQRDGIHPNAAGARKVEALVMQSLTPLLVSKTGN
jgi:acyl-CoA thioesterase-1